jgi:hypothetical protein
MVARERSRESRTRLRYDESDGKTDEAVVDRQARGWRDVELSEFHEGIVASGSMIGTTSFLINPGMSSAGGRGR